eukprot:CAMPEP_0170431134 /NCGR_PEP_ID=MMETSP0117_2-20130122/41237_1 /TAXON_ID=400756 /ORGANISM="Durinskia baltica, Strain CSIRO CS-38" /LENGTH=74 /DNA_ID=CAMNT_0010690665 /DNA_START=105 /DNA_END=329 /DNA_ORIENTATION=-
MPFKKVIPLPGEMPPPPPPDGGGIAGTPALFESVLSSSFMGRPLPDCELKLALLRLELPLSSAWLSDAEALAAA